VWQVIKNLADRGTRSFSPPRTFDEARKLADGSRSCPPGTNIRPGTAADPCASAPPAKVEYVERQNPLEAMSGDSFRNEGGSADHQCWATTAGACSGAPADRHGSVDTLITVDHADRFLLLSAQSSGGAIQADTDTTSTT